MKRKNYPLNISIILLTIIIFHSFPFITCENHLEWEDPATGNYYNFNALKRNYNNPWVYRKNSGSFSDIYRFNFNENVNHQCYGKKGSIIESFEIHNKAAATCSILGDYQNRKVNVINSNNPNEGVYLEYSGQEYCMHSFAGNQSTMRTVRFYLSCGESQEENVNFFLNILFV